MPTLNQSTSLLCVFHHQDQASAALRDLQQAGVPQEAIASITGDGSQTQLSSYGMPERDQKMLEDSLRSGAILLAVQATPQQVTVVERIFGDHSAKFVDEYDRKEAPVAIAPVESIAAPVALEAGAAIPIVEEELAVGKRTVDQGGVRVFRRVVEIPVSESVNLREEHVVVDRKAVDRPATEADLNSSGRSVELTETAEEVVLSKTAQVVEEVMIGKKSSDRVEHIEDTVRRTEVEVEELPAQTVTPSTSQRN